MTLRLFLDTETNQERRWRPPPIDKRFRYILHWLNWNGHGKIGENVERALATYLENEVDLTNCELHKKNENDEDAEILLKWLKRKSGELYVGKKETRK